MSITLNATPAMDARAEALPDAPPKRGSKRVLLLLVFLILAVVAGYFTPVRAWIADPTPVRQFVQSFGPWVFPLGILSVGLLVGCGVPRLLLCTLAGMTLGFWRGMIIGEFGTLVGYYCVFLFIRCGGRDSALHRWPKLQNGSKSLG